MPLVVPGITSNSSEDEKTQEWTNKLVGKKLSDDGHTETVRAAPPFPSNYLATGVRNIGIANVIKL